MSFLEQLEISFGLTGLLISGVHYAAETHMTDLIEYRVTVDAGETVWDACSKIVSSKDDLSEVVWRACRDSGISDARLIQPGQEIIVKVKRVKMKGGE